MNIHGKYLKALSFLAAKKDLRDYLNGVHIEVKGKQAILVATDGATLGALRIDLDTEAQTAEFIIPHTLLAGTTTKDFVEIVYDAGSATISLTQYGKVISGKAVEGLYPDWRRVIPSVITGEQRLSIFLKDLDKIAKACTLINDRPTRIVNVLHNGNGTCVTDTKNDNFIVVISPVKEEFLSNYSRPSWVSDN